MDTTKDQGAATGATQPQTSPVDAPAQTTTATLATTASPTEVDAAPPQSARVANGKRSEPPMALLLALAVGLQLGRAAWQRVTLAYLRRRVRRRLRRPSSPI